MEAVFAELVVRGEFGVYGVGAYVWGNRLVEGGVEVGDVFGRWEFMGYGFDD